MTKCNSTLDPGEYKCVVQHRLSEISINTNSIAIPLNDGTKECYTDFTQKRNRKDITQINGNYGILAKGRLHFIDLDDPGKAPDALLKNTQDTFSVSTPSDGGEHRYVVSDTPLPNIKRGWGEIRSDNQYVVGPGSSISDYGSYDIENDSLFQEVTREKLAEWIGGFDTSQGGGSEPKDEGEKIEIPEYDSDIAGFAEKELAKIQSHSMGFFYDLRDRLQGGMGDYTSLIDGGSIDRSKQDTITIQHLYGFFCDTQHYSQERAIELAHNLYSEYCEAYQHTKDGQKRKWVTRGDDYRENCIEWAVAQFDANEYRKQLRKSSKHETENRIRQNKYGEPTYGLARFIVDLAVGEYEDLTDEQIQDMILPQYNYSMSVEEIGVVRQLVNNTTMSYDTRGVSNSPCQQLEELYPTKSDVLDFCERVDRVYKGNSNPSFDTALKELQQDGIIKVAQIKSGETYVVYPCDYPDPQEANWVRCGGEKEAETQKQIATIPNYD